MDIQQMVDKNIPIYVVNRSARVLGTAHVLVIEFPHPTGGRGSTVKIPPIKHPINLTRRVAPPSAIPLSTAFIDWVNKGVLEIIPHEKAKEILSDPEVRASVKQAYKKLEARRGESLHQRPQFNVRQGGARETHAIADLDEARLSMADFQSTALPEMGLPQPAPQGALTVSAETIQIAPRIQKFCSDLQEDASLKGDYLLELKGWDEEILSDDDIGYMLSQLSEFDTICAYLRSIKASRAGSSGADDESTGDTRGRRGKRRGSKPSVLNDDDL
jgi:hypothetical protein